MQRLGNFLGTMRVAKARQAATTVAQRLFRGNTAPVQAFVGEQSVIPNGNTLNQQSSNPKNTDQNEQNNGGKDDEKKEVANKIKEQRIRHPNEPIVVMKEGDDRIIAQPAHEASRELMRLTAVWPFDFFPNELIIEEKRLIVNERIFFWSNNVTTMMINDIASANLSTSLLFASFQFVDTYGNKTTLIKWLKIREATKAKELIDGLIFKSKAKIDIAEENEDERMKALEELGEAEVTS